MLSLLLRLIRGVYRRVRWSMVAPNVWLREQLLNARVDEGTGRFIIATPRLKVRLAKGAGARLELHGNLIIRSDGGGNAQFSFALAVMGFWRSKVNSSWGMV